MYIQLSSITNYVHTLIQVYAYTLHILAAFKVYNHITVYSANHSHKVSDTWLCENQRVFLIPNFERRRMGRKSNRKLSSKTPRGMCTWSHYPFRQRLLSQAELFPWCTVIVCNEACTPKTCGQQCGPLHNKLGSSKTFLCRYNAD